MKVYVTVQLAGDAGEGLAVRMCLEATPLKATQRLYDIISAATAYGFQEVEEKS